MGSNDRTIRVYDRFSNFRFSVSLASSSFIEDMNENSFFDDIDSESSSDEDEFVLGKEKPEKVRIRC